MTDLPIIRMTWDQHVHNQDVHHAFQRINALLNDSPVPLFALVDIRTNPSFPITATLDGALTGPYRNPRLKEWLIVGINPIAQMLEKIMASATGRRNVRWFENEQEAIAYVIEQQVDSVDVAGYPDEVR